MRDQVVLELARLQELPLEQVVEAQLADGHQDGPGTRHRFYVSDNVCQSTPVVIPHQPCRRPVRAGEELPESFFPRHPGQTVNGVLVTADKNGLLVLYSSKYIVLYRCMEHQQQQQQEDSDLLSPLVQGQLDVVLHPDVDHVPRGANEATHGPGQPGHGHPLGEGDGLPARGHPLLGHFVDGEPGGGVGQLSDQRGGEPVVQGQDALVAHDAHRLADDPDLLRLAGRLQVHLLCGG